MACPSRAFMQKVFRTLVAFMALAVCFGATGCRSFLASQGLKNYAVKVKPVEGLTPNRYQEDFLYLTTLAQEVFTLEDRYFPAEKRAAMEREILRDLGRPGCSRAAFLLNIHRYLGAFNNQHATIEY